MAKQVPKDVTTIEGLVRWWIAHADTASLRSVTERANDLGYDIQVASRKVDPEQGRVSFVIKTGGSKGGNNGEDS